MAHYLQGKYTPKNPQKYVGDYRNIVYRSSWELKLFKFVDNNPNILAWGSEEIVIPYFNEMDGKPHRYFPDLVVKYKTKTGEIKKALIEVKPSAQTRPPEKKSKNTKRYLNEIVTWETNKAKWNAAKAWCERNGMMFLLMTEVELGIK